MSTFKISVLLAFAASTVPASTPADGATRVTLLDATGADITSQDTGYVFTGIAAGDYSIRAELLDVNGGTIGTPYVQAFTVAEATRTVQLPSGAAISVEPE